MYLQPVSFRNMADGEVHPSCPAINKQPKLKGCVRHYWLEHLRTEAKMSCEGKKSILHMHPRLPEKSLVYTLMGYSVPALHKAAAGQLHVELIWHFFSLGILHCQNESDILYSNG